MDIPTHRHPDKLNVRLRHMLRALLLVPRCPSLVSNHQPWSKWKDPTTVSPRNLVEMKQEQRSEQRLRLRKRPVCLRRPGSAGIGVCNHVPFPVCYMFLFLLDNCRNRYRFLTSRAVPAVGLTPGARFSKPFHPPSQRKGAEQVLYLLPQ